MSLTQSVRTLVLETAASLTGYAKRAFMARTVNELLDGTPYRAQQELGWNRTTLRKALGEARSGIVCADGRKVVTGRKAAEVHHPKLLDDLRSIVDGQSQADPSFRTARLYTRLSAGEVRAQLIAQKGYADETLPCEQTIRNKLNALGYHPQRVQKSRPQKKFPRRTRSSTK